MFRYFFVIALLVAMLPFSTASAQASCDSPVSTASADEAAELRLVNQFRQSNGLAPLALSPALQKAAVSHSALMARTGNFAHDSLFATQARFTACGESGATIGENIAGGNTDASSTFQQWVNSPEHKANILNPSFTDTGISRVIGKYIVGGTEYDNFAMWTEEFSNGSPAPSPTPQPQPPAPQPVVSINGPSTLAVGQSGTFSVPVPNTRSLLYSANFGDGTQAGWQASPSFTHAYQAAGTDLLRIWVGDVATSQISAPAQLTVTVVAAQPQPQPANVCRQAYFLNGALAQGALIPCYVP